MKIGLVHMVFLTYGKIAADCVWIRSIASQYCVSVFFMGFHKFMPLSANRSATCAFHYHKNASPYIYWI